MKVSPIAPREGEEVAELMLPGKKLTARDFLAIARRRWPLVAAPAAIGLFGGLIVSASTPNRFQSQMLIAVVPQGVPDSYVRSTVTMRIEDRIGTLAEEMRSRAQLEPLITELDLYPEERKRLPMQDVVDLMHADIEIAPVVRRGQPVTSLTMTFEYPDAILAARVTERLGALLVNQNARERSRLAASASNFLAAQVKEAQERLEAHERKLKEFRERYSGRLPSQLEFNHQALQAARLEVQRITDALARDRNQKLVLEQLYRAAETQPIVTTPVASAQSPADGSSATPTGTAKQKLQTARATLQAYEQKYKDDHPDVVRQRRLVARLEKEVASETPDSPAAAVTLEEVQRRERLEQMKSEIAGLDRQIAFKQLEEQKLTAVVADYQGRIEAVPGLESEWVKLTRDYEILQQSHKDLLAKAEASKVSLELELDQVGEQFRIVEPARVPVRPIAPLRIQINGIGAGIGLVVGLGLLALLELRDSSFRHERDVLDVLALPVLAVVPYVENSHDRARRFRQRLLVTAGLVMAVAAAGYVTWTMELWRHIV